MVWYPSVDDIIEINKLALEESKDKHPHRLRRSRESLQSTIDYVKGEQGRGLTYQAGRFMKDVLALHAFDNANHRTAYELTRIFLKKNGIKAIKVPVEIAEPFTKSLPAKAIQEIEAWILEYMVRN